MEQDPGGLSGSGSLHVAFFIVFLCAGAGAAAVGGAGAVRGASDARERSHGFRVLGQQHA